MDLDNFLGTKQTLGDNWKKFEKLVEKFKKEGMPEHIAVYKATSYLTPDRLEKIKLLTKSDEGLRTGLTFFFNNEEELKLISKYFKTNFTVKQIGNSSLLIKLLQLLETIDD